MIINNLPILQILLPFSGALLVGISFNQKLARFLTFGVSFLNLLLSVYILLKLPTSAYVFGSWQASVGIEHSFNHLNQPLIVFVNCCLLFILAFGHSLLDNCVLQHIDHSKRHLFYAVLLFAHTGYLGILSTNDLFNLYVFIEVSSLSTYVLVALSKGRKALIGSFNYLIIGTISATFILLGIGFLFSITGHLNMSYVRELIAIGNNDYPNLKIASFAFIITGCLLKIGVFPFCFWLVKIYQYTPAIIIAYLSTISSVVSFYIFLRLSYIIDYPVIFWQLLQLIAVLAIIFCAFLSIIAKDLKTLIGYAATSQIGIILIILSYAGHENLALKFIYVDSVGKLSLFMLASFYESQALDLRFLEMQALPKHQLLRCLVAFCLLCNAGLPITAMFMLKLSILNLALTYSTYFIFIALVLNNVLSLQYNYKIFHYLFFGKPSNNAKFSLFNFLVLLILLLLQAAMLFEYGIIWPSFMLTNFG